MLVTVLSVTKNEKTCEKLIETHTTLLLKKSLVCFLPFYLVPGQGILIKKKKVIESQKEVGKRAVHWDCCTFDTEGKQCLWGLWCDNVKLAGIALRQRFCETVWVQEHYQCWRNTCQDKFVLFLIRGSLLFSRFRVTCLRSWSQFFHTTSGHWQRLLQPSRDSSSPQE